MTGRHSDAFALLSAVEKQKQVVDLIREGLTFREISAQTGISTATAHRLFQAGLKLIPAQSVQEYREQQLNDLELARNVILGILASYHATVSQGRVVMLDDSPIEDHMPVMAAADRLIKITERQAKILGSDAKQEITLDGTVRYQVLGLDDSEV